MVENIKLQNQLVCQSNKSQLEKYNLKARVQIVHTFCTHADVIAYPSGGVCSVHGGREVCTLGNCAVVVRPTQIWATMCHS